jgi:hypothetical protein
MCDIYTWTRYDIYQVTFRWLQLYMGIVMIYDATERKFNKVHCTYY